MRTHHLFSSFKKAVMLLLILVFSAGCSPDLPDYIEDLDLVYTNHDKGFDFATVRTYALPDSVVHVEDPGSANHKYDPAILQELEQNLNALGWTRVSNSAATKADVVVLPAVQANRSTSCALYCWYCYWGWYPGWGMYPPVWGPGWGWGYPTDIVCSSFNTGSLAVTITTPGTASENKLPIVWVGVLNGILQGSEASITSRLQNNIDQMFNQSPYLKD